jgi:hypothetical protein
MNKEHHLKQMTTGAFETLFNSLQVEANKLVNAPEDDKECMKEIDTIFKNMALLKEQFRVLGLVL